MTRLVNIVRLINILSIDVVLGSIAMAYLWTFHFGHALNLVELFSLSLIVWLIYTTDHLLDSIKGKKVVGKRYEFHQRNKKILIPIVILASIVLLFLLFKMNFILLIIGAFVFCGVVFHFLYVHLKSNQQKKVYPKEWIVALIYTLGVSLPSLRMLVRQFSKYEIIIFLLIFLSALINLLLLSYLEAEEDKVQSTNSIVMRLGLKKVKTLILAVFSLFLLILLVAFTQGIEVNILLVFLMIGLSYFFIFKKRKYVKKEERHRLLIDAILMLPFILFFN